MRNQALWTVCAALAVLNLLSFGLMAYDKRQAKKGKSRVPERTLFLAAACFGGLGGVLGMRLCHHKTKHRHFKVFFPLLLVVQIIRWRWAMCIFYHNDEGKTPLAFPNALCYSIPCFLKGEERHGAYQSWSRAWNPWAETDGQ